MPFVVFNHAICSFLKSESLAIYGLEWGLKAFKSFLKDKKGNGL